MYPPIHHPHIPLSTPIPGGFTHGKLIRIHGSTRHSVDRFDINLLCGPHMHHDDIALHFNPRFHEHVIVRNSRISGGWGQEDRHSHEHHGHGHGHGHGHSHHFPLHAGHSFEVLFLVESHKYKIAINGHHFTEYHFRTPAERVCYLSIDGDVMISSVHFEGGSHGFPGTMPPGHLPPLGPVPVPVPIPVPVPTPLPVPMGYPSVYPPGSLDGKAYPQSYLNPPVNPGQPQPNHHPMGVEPKRGLLGGLGTAIGTAVMGKSLLNPHPSASPYSGQPSPMGAASMGAGAGLLGGLGTVMGAAAVGKAVLNPKKALKQQRKAQKKALKYGLPIAGMAGGAYLLHKGIKHAHHGFHHGSSSSSSSSSSEEE